MRCDENECLRSTNLIVNHGLTDIFHQIIELLCIISIGQELCNIASGFHQVQSFIDDIQFPSDPRVSASAPNLGDGELTFLVPFFLIPL